MSRIVRHFKDNTYQLLEINGEPFEEKVLEQGTLVEIEAYLALEERGLL